MEFKDGRTEVEPLGVDELRILVLLPDRRDAALVAGMLERTGLVTARCADLDEFSWAVQQGAGCGLLAEEALVGWNAQRLYEVLKEQPPWSDLPLILLTSGGSQASEPSVRLVRTLGDYANITILERPIRPPTLRSAVASALRARRRQYEAREYIAERQRNEEKLRETAKLESLGVLAGGIAHDFNNLLVGIMGNASLIQDALPEDDERRLLLENLLRASERAADLTRQLLAYSGRGTFVIQPVNVSNLIREIVRLMNTTLSGAVELRLELGDVPSIEADESQIQQLAMNLVINAAEAIGKGPGTVTVRTGVRDIGPNSPSRDGIELKPGCYVVLEVIDTGAGMEEAVKSRIFDPFFTTKFTGRGLGLSAVQGIVRGHNGSITVDSEPGRGTAFSVLFPAAPARFEHEKTPAGHLELEGSGTILLVDDEELVLSTARVSLEHYGYKVLAAGSGRDALALVREREDIALVLLDLTMPVMSGVETFEALHRIRPDLPVILSSGLTEAEAEERFAAQGLAGFLQKPYTAAALARKVKSVALSRSGSAKAGAPPPQSSLPRWRTA